MALATFDREVLAVERTASGEEIKRSYRRLAMKWHPDRNPGDAQAEIEFKACAEAYEVLGDEEKRRLYDQHGHAGLRGNPHHDFRSMHVEEIFSMFNDIFGGGGGQVIAPSLITVVPRMTSSSMLTLMTPSLLGVSSSSRRSRLVPYSWLDWRASLLGRSV